MALTVTVPLTDEQSDFVRQMADEINPGMTDEQLEHFLGNRFKEFMVGWIVAQLEAREGQMIQAARDAVQRKVQNGKKRAHALFQGGV